MLTRRTFLTTAAAAFGAVPQMSAAQSPEPNPVRWPAVEGAAVNQQRTRLVEGPGLVTQPGEAIPAAPDLEFLRTQEHSPTLLLANDTVFGRAMGGSLPLVAVDARTGQERWRRNRVSRLLGAAGNTVVYTVSPKSDDDAPMVIGGRIDVDADQWEFEAGEIHGSLIVDHTTLVYSQSIDDISQLLACDLATGDPVSSQSIADFGPQPPAVFASNGRIIVGSVEPTFASTRIAAWSLDSGELLWQHESELFLTSPAFHGDDIVILALDGLLKLDATTGEEIERFQSPVQAGGTFSMAITSTSAILMSFSSITAISWETGEQLWARQPIQSRGTSDFLVCDDVLYRLEDTSGALVSGRTIRGYDINSGRLTFEYTPVDADQQPLQAASFLVGNGHLYMSSDRGIFTFVPGEMPLPKLIDPAMDREHANTELGFSYTWDDQWESGAASFMTPNGQSFNHSSNGAVAAQSAGEANENDYDFGSNWHANLGPDDRYIREIKAMDAPSSDFVPENAEVLGVEYATTLNAPYDQLFGVRILIPLSDDNVLVFEFLQAESLFDDTVESFATFFENLQVN